MADRLSLLWRCLNKRPTGVLISVLATLTFGLSPHSSGAEPYPDLLGASLQPHRIYRNYAGDFVMRFPNYDFVLFSPTRSSPVLPEEADVDTASSTTPRLRLNRHGPIVFRNEAGMKWDGSRMFLHPAYPYRVVERFRFALNIIGEPIGTKWPDLQPEMVSPPPVREPKVFEPPVGYRPLPQQPPVVVVPTEGLPKFSPLGTALKPTDLMPQYRHPVPAGPIPTHPVSTIRVRPWPSAEVAPPQHDSLGTVTPTVPVMRR